MFTHWSNGGTLDQTFATPTNDTVFTAYYAMPTLNYSVGNDTVLCTGDAITIDAGADYITYAWNDGSVGEYFALQSAVADTFTYTVTVTDSTGAAGTDTITVVYEICDAVPATQSEVVHIYPVPSNGEIMISGLSQNYFISVTDMTGKVFISNGFAKANEVKRIELPAGIYSLMLTDMNHEVISRKKVVVVK